ncbi:MAG: hypothetical protein LBV04_09265, partial [Deferribacteraceae bacterium]|nr:hypothetical protein [Deferribacteraceae bacterium]
IEELGGTCDFNGQSLLEDMQSIEFDDDELMGDAELCDEYGDILLWNVSLLPYGDAGDWAEDEWNAFKDTAKKNFKQQFNKEASDFLFIALGEYERLYFISLSDENPDNPTVYKTMSPEAALNFNLNGRVASGRDFFFSTGYETSEFGTLEDFFDSCISEDEYDEDMIGE